MIFLSKIDNMTLCRTTCYPDDVPRLNRNTAIIIPTKDEDVMLSVLNKFKSGIGRMKIKNINYMYYPKTSTFKAGIKTIKYLNKNYNPECKILRSKSGCVITQSTGVIRDYNMIFNYSKIIDKLYDTKIIYNKFNISTIWKTIINFQGINHDHRYLVITPEVSKIHVRNAAVLKMSSWKVKDLYISLLYHLIYRYDEFLALMRKENCGLLFTDYRYSLKVDFNDAKFKERFPDKGVFLKELFFNLRRMSMGYHVDEEEADIETLVDNGVPIQETVEDSTIDDTTVTKTMEIVNKLDLDKKSDINDKEKAENISEELVEVIEEEKPLTSKEKKIKEKVKQITDIVEKDQKKNISIPMRLETVQKKQQKILDDNLEEVLARLEDIAESMIKPDVVKRNNTFGTFRINQMDKQYEEIAKKDRLEIAESLNKNSVPLYLTNYKDVQNNNTKDTYSRKVQMTFESPYNNKEKHTFTMNIPELRDGKFLHLNGSDKVMIRQKIALPIIRLDDGVVCTSYYGKLFIRLTNGNLSKSVARIKSFVKLCRKKFTNNYLKKWFSFTPAFYTAKSENILGPELLEISRFLEYIKIDKNNYLDLGSKTKVVAKIDGEEWKASQIEDTFTNLVGGEVINTLELFDKIISKLIEEDKPIYELWKAKSTGTVSKNVAYSRVERWPGGNTPLLWLVLHAYGENLLPLLELLNKEYGLTYEIVPKQGTKLNKSKFNTDDSDRFLFDNFALDVKYNNVSNQHLLYPLHQVDLTSFSSLQLTGISDMVTNSSNVVMSMETYEDLFWDPITKKVMDDTGVPTDYAESLIYANNLLNNYDRTVSEISLKNERMPSNSEIIQGAMYACLAKEYRDYSIKVKRGSRMASFSVQQDAIISYLATLPNVEESSKINSIQHVDKLYSVSNKGISGINNSRSYTINKRKWDQTFYGIMSDVSPYGPATGIVKHLSVNPNIKDIRGYFVSKDPKDTNPDEMMSVSEALRPFTQKHDSSPRTAMSMMQSNHLMGTEGAEPALVTYGMDETMASLDSDFAKRLKDDAEIILRNDRFIKLRYMNLKNEDGSPLEEIIDLDNIERNSAKAFFTPNKMKINSKFNNAKVGTKVRKDDVIAYNGNYYQEVGDEVVFKSGPIVNIALMNTQYAYEDATCMSEYLAQRLQTKVLKRIAVKLNPRNQIKEVRTKLGIIFGGDTLIKYSEDSGSSFLNSSYDLSALEETLMKNVKSNYNGNLRDIYVYYKLSQRDEDEMDNSIKKFINTVDNYYRRTFDGSELERNIPEYEKNRIISHVTKFSDTRKNTVNGDLVNKGEILIEFFIEVNQNFSSGDKITIGNTALKGVGSKIFPNNKRPKGVNTGTEYDLILSTYSPLSRMIYSTFMIGPLTSAMDKINENILDIIKSDK